MKAIRHCRVIYGPLMDRWPMASVHITRHDPDSRFAGLRNTAPTMAIKFLVLALTNVFNSTEVPSH